MRAGGFFFIYIYIFFLSVPLPAAAYLFKAIKESINKKLFLIDRLGEKAIIQSINLAKVFKQDVLAHS